MTELEKRAHEARGTALRAIQAVLDSLANLGHMSRDERDDKWLMGLVDKYAEAFSNAAFERFEAQNEGRKP